MCTYGKSACFPAIPETLAEQSNSNIFGMKQKLPSVQRTGHCSVNEKRAKIKTHRKCPCYGRLHSMSRKSCNAIEKSMNGGMNISRSIHPFSEYIKRWASCKACTWHKPYDLGGWLCSQSSERGHNYTAFCLANGWSFCECVSVCACVYLGVASYAT